MWEISATLQSSSHAGDILQSSSCLSYHHQMPNANALAGTLEVTSN